MIEIQFNKIPSLPGEVQKEIAKAIASTTIDVEARAKEKAPVETGNLRASITHELSDDGLTGTITPGADYAIWVEIGTHKRAATPYLRPATEEAQDEFTERIQAAVNSAAGGS